MLFEQLKQDIAEPIYSPAGNEIKKIYEMRMTKTGHKYIKETGEVNIREKIQEHKEDCDAKTIIQRARMGDPNAIERIQNARTNYGDTTLIPHNLMEAQQMIIDGKKAFEKLPKEIRQEFNNDPMQFLANEKKVAQVTEKYLIEKGVITKKPETKQTTKEGDEQ